MIAIIEMRSDSDPEVKEQNVPVLKRRYTLTKLLARCEGGSLTQEDSDWLAAPNVGLEMSFAVGNEVVRNV